MGKGNVKKQGQPVKQSMKQDKVDDFGFDEDGAAPDSQTSGTKDDFSSSSKGKKRPRNYNDRDDDDDADFGQEMQKMLETFGADVSKTLVGKRKRLESYTNNTIRASNKKIEDIWTVQQNERQKLNAAYCKQVTSVFQQWELDLEKVKEQEDKLQNLLKQQQKLFQQTRVVQNQRLKTIRQLHDQYTKSLEELEECHQSQQSNVQVELKKEMSLLQKRILMDTQQQEMASVRKSLQTMLF